MRLVQVFGIAAAMVAMQANASPVTVTVTNPTDDDWKEAPVVVPLQNAIRIQSVEVDGKRVGVQSDDLDGDGKHDELVFLAALKPRESKQFKLLPDAPEVDLKPRAHTGMYMKTDTMKGMEGPGWESDLVAFRIYWDYRNATDVFCKRLSILSLEKYAEKGYDYHVNTQYGMDVLKVGTALGIGGFGVLDDEKVVKVADAKREFKMRANGPLRAVCDFDYTDWTTSSGRKLALTARQFIYAGQCWAECELDLEALDGKPLLDPVAGVVHHKGTSVIKYGDLGIAGTWGNQALGDNQVPNSGNLGLGVTANPDDILAVNMDPVSLYMKLKTKDGKVRYRYVANWYKQPDAVQSAQEFKDYMARVQRLRPVVEMNVGNSTMPVSTPKN